MTSTVAIIPARGGSKGIPRKNLVDICGKPLIAWSILQALNAKYVDSVWVTSDDDEILAVAESFGARPIRRPSEISDDKATSESAWLHALDAIEELGIEIELVVAMQATSPIRESSDIDSAIHILQSQGFDTLMTVAEVEDYFMWSIRPDGSAGSANYDYENRKRRQQIEKSYLENGSFYLFRPKHLRKTNNRLGGRIGMYKMKKYKMFQIDNPEDIQLCAAVLYGFGLDKA